ncbi:Uncharacterised protein [Tatumella ptyseos]|uniref:Uncharacterized protein n=1 Tax=Tatumella ptyseos TaxID=82987 RepID=A0A2X5NK08_9GAMM|nr:Uncharacterised protein [Tatumella ptyseos]
MWECAGEPPVAPSNPSATLIVSLSALSLYPAEYSPKQYRSAGPEKDASLKPEHGGGYANAIKSGLPAGRRMRQGEGR